MNLYSFVNVPTNPDSPPVYGKIGGNMNREDHHHYIQADLLANLSFLGIILPLVGWILVGISASKIKLLTHIYGDQEIFRGVRHKLISSVIWSVTVIILWIIGFMIFLKYLWAQQLT